MKQLLLFTVCMYFGLQLYANTPFEDKGLSWKVEKGVLTISKTGNGTGEMPNYAFGGETAPWNSKKNTITQLIIGEGVTSIGDYAFENYTELTSVEMAGTVQKIGAYAFSCCSKLAAIKLPESLKTIGYRSFYFCSGLESVRISGSLTTILDEGFASCINLTEVRTKAIVPPVCKNNVFAGIPSDCKLYVPKDSKSAYETTPTWKDFNPILIDEEKENENEGGNENEGEGEENAIDVINGNAIVVYPNPATDGFYIDGLTDETTQITILNIQGKAIYSKIVVNKEYISANSLSPGIYIIKLEISDEIVIRKLIKQ